MAKDLNSLLQSENLTPQEIKFIKLFNKTNIITFDNETNFFSHKSESYSTPLEMFNIFVTFFSSPNIIIPESLLALCNNGEPSYTEFKELMALCLNFMRQKGLFNSTINYDWLDDNFKKQFPEIFIDTNAPLGLKRAFYSYKISPSLLHNHPEYIPFLQNKKATSILDIKTTIQQTSKNQEHIRTISLEEEYSQKYGTLEFLKLCAKYGNSITNLVITVDDSFHFNQKQIEEKLEKSIYQKLLQTPFPYSYLETNVHFKTAYPDIFISLQNIQTIPESEKQRIEKDFYDGTLKYEDIRRYPELIGILKSKNLLLAFRAVKNLDLLKILGNALFLELCLKYGQFLSYAANGLQGLTIIDGSIYDTTRKMPLTFPKLCQQIENIIAADCMNGIINYSMGDAPEFLTKNYPELFLDDKAPTELKAYFYNNDNKHPLDFIILNKHRDWISFIQGKNIATALLKNPNTRENMQSFLRLFGLEEAITLGLAKSVTVTEMINQGKVTTMKAWYNLTNKTFLPDSTVMLAFPINEANKFIKSKNKWRKIVRLIPSTAPKECLAAFLKLAYTFGVFDDNEQGFKRLINLMTYIPQIIEKTFQENLEKINSVINHYTKGIKIPKDGQNQEQSFDVILKHIQKIEDDNKIAKELVINFLTACYSEKIDIDYSQDIFSQVYHTNSNGDFTLTFDQQQHPHLVTAIRRLLETDNAFPILTPFKAHQIFGNLSLSYDYDFQKFLSTQMKVLLADNNKAQFIDNIKRQFTDIKTVNNNRVLTLDLAIAYIKINRYINVEPGNELLANAVTVAGYDQKSFEILQRIYNFGKQRIFSSIPRITGTYGDFTYEVTRLDNPLPLVIGILTNCCQKLNDKAEICMEHSMTDKNGRLFIIRDNKNNVVAQSWIWRNQDVLCFDNIEIPDKAFKRAAQNENALSPEELCQLIYNIYRQAASQFIETDNHSLLQLLNKEYITPEQYENLRLSKITVGIGHNDIAKAITKSAIMGNGVPTKPLAYTPPVNLTVGGLYLCDSETQYIILNTNTNRNKQPVITPAIYFDAPLLYTDKLFTKVHLYALARLEEVTKNKPCSFSKDIKETHIVTGIAHFYNLDPDNTRIILHGNFAIIFCTSADVIQIADLFFVQHYFNNQENPIEETLIIQLSLALQYIAKDKEIYAPNLLPNQQDILNRALKANPFLEYNTLNSKLSIDFLQ